MLARRAIFLFGSVFNFFCKMWGEAHILQKIKFTILFGLLAGLALACSAPFARPVPAEPARLTPGQTATHTATLTPLVETRQAPTVEGTPQPGLQIWGWVRLDAQDAGSGLAGVQIFRAYAGYPGEVAAVSEPDGSYQSPF